MLSQEQTWEYNRYQKLSNFFTASAAAYSGFAPFAGEVADFQNNFANLQSLVPGKNHVASGITTDKATLKHNLSDELGLVCKKTYAYALKTSNAPLAAAVTMKPDTIFKMRDADVLSFATTINTIVTPLLTDAVYLTYSITAPVMNAILASANTFNDMIGKADNMSSGNTVANTAINKDINLVRGNIKQFDLLVDEFETTNPEFVQGYHINSSVDKTGIRHNGIEGTVKDKTGAPISGATVLLQNTTKTTITDLNGYYHLDRTAAGDFMIECSAAGYTSQTREQHIARGRTEEMNWQL